MSQPISQHHILELFGVLELHNKLTHENRHEDLKEIEKTISEFILLKAWEDLSEEKRVEAQSLDLENGKDLYDYFQKNIPDFSNKLQSYGSQFRSAL